jgi:hypothetical protein
MITHETPTIKPFMKFRIPPFIKLANQSSDLILDQIATGERSSGLIIITGAQAKGKTILTRKIESYIGDGINFSAMPDEGCLKKFICMDHRRLLIIDNINTAKKPWRKQKTIDSPALLSAIDNQYLVILSGSEINLCQELEYLALRIHLI